MLLEVTIYPEGGMSEAWSLCGDLSILFEAEAVFRFVIFEKFLKYFFLKHKEICNNQQWSITKNFVLFEMSSNMK